MNSSSGAMLVVPRQVWSGPHERILNLAARDGGLLFLTRLVPLKALNLTTIVKQQRVDPHLGVTLWYPKRRAMEFLQWIGFQKHQDEMNSKLFPTVSKGQFL